jgi:hypothetical protein
MMKKKQKYPRGWDEAKVRRVLAHYEGQGEDEQFADIESARKRSNITLMGVPTKLVPQVHALLARERRKSQKRAAS